jgi:hypothetical protein
MRSIPNEAHKKWMRAVRDGGLQRQKVWLVTAAGGGKRGVNTTISQKWDAQGAGHQSEKTAMVVRAMVMVYAAVRSEATAAMTTTTTTTTLTMMTAADTSVEAAAMVTGAEARAMVAAMAK